MSQSQQYEEGHGSQSQWIDTHEAKPYKIPTKWFIDIDDVTVAKADSIQEITSLLEYYPHGTVRYYNPTQEEYEAELKALKELYLNNFGIMQR